MRAILAVYDKEGIEEFAQNLFSMGCEIIATGGTAEAASKLIELSKGKIGAFIFVINLFDLGGSDKLIKKGFKVENLIEFPGH